MQAKKKKNVTHSGSTSSIKTSKAASDKVVPQWGMANYMPKRPSSEDEGTTSKHIKWLQLESKKRQPDFRQVAQLMQKTLADRRHWIVNTEPHPKVGAVIEMYPWLLRDDDQVSKISCKYHAKGKNLYQGLDGAWQVGVGWDKKTVVAKNIYSSGPFMTMAVCTS